MPTILSYEIKDESGKTASWKSGVFYVKGSTPCAHHTKGAYLFAEAVHPHYIYYKCNVCDTNFTDGSTKKLDSCTICNPPKPNCDKGHTWGGWQTVKNATCKDAGQRKRVCSVCGKAETETIAATNNHTWSGWTVTKNTSCGVAGQKQRTCSICGRKETQTIAALSHTWGNWTITKNASCGVAGEKERTCIRCGMRESDTIEALSHDYQMTTQMTTYHVYTCSNCGDSYRVDTAFWVDIPLGSDNVRNISIGNSNDDEFSCLLVTACYEDGRLTGLSQRPLDLPPFSSLYTRIDVPAETGSATWKVFLLDDETLAPLLPNLEY